MKAMFPLILSGALLLAGCAREGEPESQVLKMQRERMVDQVEAYGVRSLPVLNAMRKVRRHAYIPAGVGWLGDPYGDHPCPIGHGQTISQPFIVAYMTEKVAPQAGEKILEIGTGSGYQAAILAEMGAEVYTIEIVAELAAHARQVLAAEGYGQVKVISGDGYKGWPDYAPFDVIIVTCAPESIPAALVQQLKEGGRMILPVGRVADAQRLVILRRQEGEIVQKDDLMVRFVPMVKATGD
jgi:protein-L-isoaspartate(D-aspartate) O-methyltransferase